MRTRVARVVAVVDLPLVADDREEVVLVDRLRPEGPVPVSGEEGARARGSANWSLLVDRERRRRSGRGGDRWGKQWAGRGGEGSGGMRERYWRERDGGSEGTNACRARAKGRQLKRVHARDETGTSGAAAAVLRLLLLLVHGQRRVWRHV